MEAMSPRFSGWRAKGRSQKQAVGSETIESADLLALLEGGVNRSDVVGSAFPNLGFRWSAWNGDVAASVSVSVTCGASASRTGVLNSFVVRLPELDHSRGLESIYATLESLLSGVVEAWSPEWAVISSHEIREHLDLRADQPSVGWLTYVGPGRNASALGVEFGDGTLVRAATVWEKVVVEDVAEIAASLERVGALRPIGR
jgi:hypothetical protein